MSHSEQPTTASVDGEVTAPHRRADHALPMLRVHRAWEAAEEIAERSGVDRSVALEIAREVVAIIGEGTRRWGHLCPSCRALLTWEDKRLTCPEHGALYASVLGAPATTLLILFDPLTGRQ